MLRPSCKTPNHEGTICDCQQRRMDTYRSMMKTYEDALKDIWDTIDDKENQVTIIAKVAQSAILKGIEIAASNS